MPSELTIALIVAAVIVVVLVVVVIYILQGAMKKDGEHLLTAPSVAQGLQILHGPKESAVAAAFQSAIEVLRHKVSGRSFTYRAPWILMIGPEDSGKASILHNLSGAALPDPRLPPGDDRSGIRFGFLNGGVIINVPGSSLLGPNPNVRSDEAAWEQMLHRLNHHRPARPLDGVVLTFPASDLLNAQINIAAQAALIRAKLDSLQSAAGLVLPVYVVITKCDVIPGFGTFCSEFESGKPEARKQIFGWSNPHTLDSLFSWAWVDEAMASLRDSIAEHQLRFFGAERTLTAPDRLFLFPPEFQKLQDPLRTLLHQLFVPVSYRDSHYFRGVYFTGLPEERPEPATGEVAPQAEVGTLATPIFFLEHLFERKIFAERSLARPVAQDIQYRNRAVFHAQVVAVVVSLVMMVWLTVDYFRLTHTRDEKLLPALTALAPNLEVAPENGSVESAYRLAEAFAVLHTWGFKSWVMPASWNDPIDSELQKRLQDGFSRLVLDQFRIRLESEYTNLIADQNRTALPKEQARPDCATTVGGPDSVWFSPADNPQYEALRLWLGRVTALEQQIQVYERLRTYGSGSVADVLELLEHLSGRQLPEAKQYQDNPYFTRAIQAVKWGDVKVGPQRADAANYTGRLISDYYREWFDNSILLDRVACVQKQVTAFEHYSLNTAAQLRSLAGQIADLDQAFSATTMKWLDEPVSMASDPVLSQFDRLKLLYGDRFPEVKAEEENQGQDAWQKLRANLMRYQTAAGTVLERGDPERFHVSNQLKTLGNNLQYLTGLDFMAPSEAHVTAVLPNTPVFWSAAVLDQALKVSETWQKYQNEVLVTAQPALARPLREVAQSNFLQVMTELVSRAHSPLTVSTKDDSLLAELKNFNQTLEARKQIWQIGSDALSAGNVLINSLGLYPQATRLLGAADRRLQEDSYYSYDPAFLKAWDGSAPPSLAIYKASSPDNVSEDVNSDHTRLETLVNDILPVEQLLSPTLPVNPRWNRLSDDLKAFSDKKPGNPIATVENFLRQDIDKITPENHCQAAPADSRLSDPIIGSFNTLRSDTVTACLMALRQRYIALATLFHDHLAGKFPFASDPATPDEADPKYVADFFALYDRDGAILTDSLDRLATLDPAYRAPAGQAIVFLRKVGQIRPLFAVAEGTDIPVLDVTPAFRTNRDRESGGNQIIFWQLKIADYVYPYPATAKPVRWQYNDPVRLTLRYASDSPYVPAPKGPDSTLVLAGRELTYAYPGGWSLFRLLLSRAASSSDFDAARAMPNTIRLSFPNGPAASALSGAKQPDDTRVFVSFTLQSPASKDAAAVRNGVALSELPVSAPVIP